MRSRARTPPDPKLGPEERTLLRGPTAPPCHPKSIPLERTLRQARAGGMGLALGPPGVPTQAYPTGQWRCGSTYRSD